MWLHQGYQIVIFGAFLAFLDFFPFLHEISCTFVSDIKRTHFGHFSSLLVLTSPLRGDFLVVCTERFRKSSSFRINYQKTSLGGDKTRYENSKNLKFRVIFWPFFIINCNFALFLQFLTTLRYWLRSSDEPIWSPKHIGSN